VSSSAYAVVDGSVPTAGAAAVSAIAPAITKADAVFVIFFIKKFPSHNTFLSRTYNQFYFIICHGKCQVISEN
jgi:hypothetical protein